MSLNVVVLWVGSWIVMRNQMTIGELMTYNALLAYFLFIAVVGIPLIVIFPPLGSKKLTRSLTNVDLPEPLIPTIASFSPLLMFKSISCRMFFP